MDFNKKFIRRWISKNPNFYASTIALLIYISSWQVVAHESGITFCKEDEDIYFSCSLSGSKIVSVCASGNTDPGTGYIQYRHGTPGNIEMTYPEKAVPPKGYLFLVNASEGSVNKDIIKFKNDSYTYIIAQSTVSSLSVLKNDKVLWR